MRRLGYCLAFLLGMAAMVAIQGRTQDYAIVSGLALHLDGKEHCNSTTTGLGVEHDGYAIGFFRNSNCRWSTYAAKYWTPLHVGIASFGVLGGVVTGYSTSPMPAGGFVAALEFGRQKVNVIFIPPVGSSGNVIWLQSGLRW